MVEYNFAKVKVARSNRVIHSRRMEQLVARRFHSPKVGGSSPLPAHRGMAEWTNASDLKSEKLKNFVGSNPTSSCEEIV